MQPEEAMKHIQIRKKKKVYENVSINLVFFFQIKFFFLYLTRKKQFVLRVLFVL